jgi:hypothetical protein
VQGIRRNEDAEGNVRRCEGLKGEAESRGSIWWCKPYVNVLVGLTTEQSLVTPHGPTISPTFCNVVYKARQHMDGSTTPKMRITYLYSHVHSSDYRRGVWISHRIYWMLSNFNTEIQEFFSSLEHKLSIFCLFCLYQSSGNDFQRQTFLFLRISELSPCLTHSDS